jgi:excisionase family DNA binding protein
MMTVSEVAKVLRISVWKAYRLIERRELGYHRLDGSIRVTQTQLVDYLRRTEHTPKGTVRPKSPPDRTPFVHTRLQPRRTRDASRRIK